MKSKFLSFVILGALSLACLSYVSPIKTQAISLIQINTTESSTSSSDETFEVFLEKIGNLDIDSLKDKFSKETYDKIYQKISDKYKSQNKSYSEDELKLRTNIYVSYIFDLYKDENNIDEAVKYLELPINDMMEILTSLELTLSPFDLELFKFKFTSLLTDPTKLSDEDSEIYSLIEQEFLNEFKDFKADDMRDSINLFWAMSRLNLSQFVLEDKVKLLKSIPIDFESFQDLKALTISGVSDEIISELYEVVLLRNADEDGKKFWVDLLQKFINQDKSFKDSINDIVNRLRESEEYKALIGKNLFN